MHGRASLERWVGWGLLGLLVAIALGRAFAGDLRPPEQRLSDAERAAVGRAAAEREPEWRAKSARSFPEDHWSQDDDFHASELSWVRSEAGARGVPPSEIFRAIDEELRRHPPRPPRKATASPCKPRPFYD